MSIARKILMGSSGGKKSTYVDDVFSTYIYEGTQTAKTITNGIDLAGEGGMVWIKNRVGSWGNNIFDTERGAGKIIRTNNNNPYSQASFTLNAFNSDGFGIGNDSMTNANGGTTVSWSFRKQKGFFDVVTYTGNDTNRTISHSLGCVPGFMMIKRLDDYGHWRCYHKDRGPTKHILLSASGAEVSGSNSWNNTAPTASVFSLGTATELNNNGSTYVAYLFAGGESTADTARSVVCDASGDYLSLGSSSDLAMGTGDFTIEGWYKINAKQNFGFFMNGPSGLSSTYGTVVWNYTGSGYGLQFITSGGYQATGFTPPPDQWFHLALVRNSGTTSLYYNGELLKAA